MEGGCQAREMLASEIPSTEKTKPAEKGEKSWQVKSCLLRKQNLLKSARKAGKSNRAY